MTDPDDSSRRAPQPLKLFHPIIHVPLLEVVRVNDKGSLETTTPITTAYTSFAYTWSEELEMGRGLFPTRYNLLSTDLNFREKWLKVLHEAESKFSATSKSLLSPNEVSNMVLAVIAAKFGVQYASNLISSDLMSSRMALGLYLTPDREFLQAGYIGEPIISAIVTRYM